MTDHAGYPDAKDTVTQHNTNGSIDHKRKRDLLDQETSSRPSPSEGPRMANYRVSESATNAADPSTASFLSTHHVTATTEDGLRQSASNSIDFSSLGQNSTVEHDQEHAHQRQNPQPHEERDHGLHPNGRANIPSASDTAAAALRSHYSMTVPQATELSFQTQGSAGGASTGPPGSDSGRQINSSFGLGDQHNSVPHGHSHGMSDYSIEVALKAGTHTTQMPVGGESPPDPTTSGRKPTVGSDEWNKIRRDNHKEVERRRRETINEGINELAKIVPGCEKNKGSILQRAVQFITQLKENEAQNIEKWTLEKLLTEQAIAELSASCDKFKAECQRAWTEMEAWKKAACSAGVDADMLRIGNGGDGNVSGSTGGSASAKPENTPGGNGEGNEDKRTAEETSRSAENGAVGVGGNPAMDGSDE